MGAGAAGTSAIFSTPRIVQENSRRVVGQSSKSNFTGGTLGQVQRRQDARLGDRTVFSQSSVGCQVESRHVLDAASAVVAERRSEVLPRFCRPTVTAVHRAMVRRLVCVTAASDYKRRSVHAETPYIYSPPNKIPQYPDIPAYCELF